MVVHLYGQACWNEKLEGLAKKYNIKIIEDNAQAIGAIWHNKKTGALGDASGFSFYPGKNLGALGDAGAVATNDNEIAEIVRSLGNYGSKKKYYHEFQGYNSRLDEMQAAFLNIKIDYIDEENKKRRKVAEMYCEHICHPEIVLPQNNGLSHVWHLFVIRTKNREKFQNYLLNNGIQTLIHYPIPPHKQVAFSNWNKFKFPITEKIQKEIVSLPISSVISKSEIAKIIEAVNKY